MNAILIIFAGTQIIGTQGPYPADACQIAKYEINSIVARQNLLGRTIDGDVLMEADKTKRVECKLVESVE